LRERIRMASMLPTLQRGVFRPPPKKPLHMLLQKNT
jgi:hypothetical protein